MHLCSSRFWAGVVVGLALVVAQLAPAYGDCSCVSELWEGEYHPAYAPHSSRLAFTTSNSASPEYWMWIVGGDDFYHGAPTFGLGYPSWAPDENHIAFAFYYFGIAMFERGDSFNQRTLLSGQLGDNEPSWSPAGGMIAFIRAGDIWRMTETGGGQSQVTTLGGCSAPAVSPDGSRVAFEKGGNVWIQGLASGSTPYILTEGHRPAWSPNGNWIAFDSNRAGNPDVWVIALGGSSAVRITSDPGNDTDPTWSGDGTTIAYTHQGQGQYCSCLRTEQTLPDYTVGVEPRTWSGVKSMFR
jgi:Tol biopolymer transport system component